MKTTKIILGFAASLLLVPMGQAQEVIRERVTTEDPAAVRVQPAETVGTITQFGDGSVAVRTETSATPIQYRFAKTTQWVDEAGNVVTREHIRTGVPVTVYYTRAPEGLVVSKVIVRRTTEVAPAPVGEERTTTTTVDRPAPAGEVPAPRVIERREVEKERPAPKVIERPAVVEKPDPTIVEKKTTTTTTTTVDEDRKHKHHDHDDDKDRDKDHDHDHDKN